MKLAPGFAPFRDDFIAEFINRWTRLIHQQTACTDIDLLHTLTHDEEYDRLAVTVKIHPPGLKLKERTFVCTARLIRTHLDIQPAIDRLERFMVDLSRWAAAALLASQLDAANAHAAAVAQASADSIRSGLPGRPRLQIGDEATERNREKARRFYHKKKTDQAWIERRKAYRRQMLDRKKKRAGKNGGEATQPEANGIAEAAGKVT